MSTSEFSNVSGKNYSDFGKYVIKDRLTINLPDNNITFAHLNENDFSYKRQNAQNEEIKKIIHPRTADFQIGLEPVLPIYTPSYKTSLFFMRFTEQIYISQKSTMEFLVPFPIEIGVFLIEGKETGLVDCFSCDAASSRFALYGVPDNGKLCKYAQIPIETQTMYQPFTRAQLKVRITNNLEEGASIGKIVFTATDHELHFHRTDVMMDGLNVNIKDRIGVRVMDTASSPISRIEGWKKAIRDIEKTNHGFNMEKDFD